MAVKTEDMKFQATPEKGDASGLLARPTFAGHLLVLGHGASSNMRHATLHPLDTADHGFHVLKPSSASHEDVFVEMVRVVTEWAGRAE